MVWARRGVQTLCLALFFWLFWKARFYNEGPPGRYVDAFFDLDPLVLAATWLAAYAVPVAALWALLTVGVTIVFGRVFCGWVCPLGTVHHLATWIGRVMRRGKPKAQPYSRGQNAKQYLWVGLLVMAVFGGHWIGVFDPIAQLTRVTATVLYPAVQYGIEDGATAVYHADPHLGPLHVTSVTEPGYRFMRRQVFVSKRQVFSGGVLIGLLFVGALLLNLYRRRFWCRYVCPLGGLLGWLSQRQMLRLGNAPNPCRECGQCAVVCPAGASPEKPRQWRAAECFGCWNCVSACRFDALAFSFGLPLRAASEAPLDLGKRATLAAGAGGVAGLLLFRLEPQNQGKTYNPALIRPPGSRAEREFLKRCLQCGLCMKACPTNGLQPTGLDAGLEGLWTPKLVPRIGYCEYNCNLCGQVCPTEAIKPLSVKDKQAVRIGLAAFDTSRCLPWAYERECLICEEHCPVSPKAIFFRPKEVTKRDGIVIVVKQPYVDAERCTGCGICEAKCVYKDKAAVRVSSANESRHPGNQPILSGSSGDGARLVPSTGGDSGYFNSQTGGTEGTGSSPYGS